LEYTFQSSTKTLGINAANGYYLKYCFTSTDSSSIKNNKLYLRYRLVTRVVSLVGIIRQANMVGNMQQFELLSGFGEQVSFSHKTSRKDCVNRTSRLRTQYGSRTILFSGGIIQTCLRVARKKHEAVWRLRTAANRRPAQQTRATF
jgi:hypothetical protein